MNDIEKDLGDAKALTNLLDILTKLYTAGEKDPLLMSDAEFNNFCNLVLASRSQLELLKKAAEKVDRDIKVAEALVTMAKYFRGEMNNGEGG